MKLSIIIPLYNCEEFITQCLESVLDNNISSDFYEVVVINDGSSDNGPTIVKSICNKFENLILLNQKNKGNGAARNKGVQIAKGEYLYFLDADDYMEKNSLELLLNELDSSDIDILGFGSRTSANKGCDVEQYNQFEFSNSSTILNGINFIKKYNYKAEIWWYFVKKEHYEKCRIRFYDNKFVQDAFITTKLLLYAQKIKYLPFLAHRYRRHDNSITSKRTPMHISKHINDLQFSITKLNELIQEITDQGILRRLKARRESYFFFSLLRFPKSDLSLNDLKNLLVQGKIQDVYPLKHFIGPDYNGPQYRFLVFIINHNVFLFPFMIIQRMKENIQRRLTIALI